MAIIALLISLGSLFYTYRAVTLTQQSLKQHLVPALSCQLDDIHEWFPLFALENEGSIAVESISVNHLHLCSPYKAEISAEVSLHLCAFKKVICEAKFRSFRVRQQYPVVF
jgi:hypothetical protein